MGSISVTRTRAPYERSDSAHCCQLHHIEEKMAYTLADVTEAGDNGDLASEHNVGGPLDTVHEGLAAAVLLVSS